MERLEVPRRQRTMHTRLNEFLTEISNNKQVRSSILTVGDGVALIQKL
jgi:predicted O-methyltransferase YrrM